ncbi:MAG: hypothetical protein BGO69_07285 [Bacteroidetes bacterium 46-16]|nr:MAG: hypothetical protein BGO69_07285 [Bacteroidetes bacterium 46-16]
MPGPCEAQPKSLCYPARYDRKEGIWGEDIHIFYRCVGHKNADAQSQAAFRREGHKNADA